MPVTGQQRRRRPHVRAVTARPGQPRRGGRAGHLPACRAGHPGHLVLGHLQPHRRGVGHLHPRGHRPLQAGQVMPAPRALAGRHHGDQVRVTAPGQRVSLLPRLAAARTRRALPGLLGASGPRRQPVRPRRHRGVGRVHPHPPLQLLDLGQQRRDHRIPLRQGSQQLLTAELPGIGHALKLRISPHSSHDHRNRRVYLKSDTGIRPEWIPTRVLTRVGIPVICTDIFRTWEHTRLKRLCFDASRAKRLRNAIPRSQRPAGRRYSHSHRGSTPA